jgi:demethylmenaquinone methyltransferase / 2-methoxy-6-polyprenyl-1,4-benzoquinol methylase
LPFDAGDSPARMANTYYQPGDQRAAKVGDLFAAVARRYDRVNDLQSFGLHRRWKRRVAQMAEPRPGERALDVCCGTGDLAFALARAGAVVTGLDFSAAMLAVAEERRAADNRPASSRLAPRAPSLNPQFVHGDAMRLPFADDSFDLVTVGYGLRNLADWSVGLQEMWRVAKPDGRLLVLDFGKPDNPVWRGVYFAYLRWIVPWLGRLVAGNAPAYRYILESLRQYPAQRGVARRMEELRCADVRIVHLLGGAMSVNYGRKTPGSGR